MDNIKDFLEKLVDEYSLMLLGWAYKKLGDKEAAEELVQDVWLEVFRAVKSNADKGLPIEKSENLIWKIAHFVWCHHLRGHTRHKMFVPVCELEAEDPSDFVQELADSEETRALITDMRNRIVRLNFCRREIMILFYIEGKTQKEIASRLGMTESTVKWYLFDTRKKLKEEMVSMKETNFVYRPRQLHMALTGNPVPNPDIDVINRSLSKQNICIQCYHAPKTLDALAETLGIPGAYLEYDLEWLVEREFLRKTKQGYSTLFSIETTQDEQDKYAVYLRHKERLSDVIIGTLLSEEETIRKIGFCGCDKPFDRLLWLLIYRFCNELNFSLFEIDEPIRPDGGKYFPLGFDRTDKAEIKKVLDDTHWGYNGSMGQDGFYWFGLYNFGKSEIEDMIDQYLPEWRELNTMLRGQVHSDFAMDGLNEKEKGQLAKLVQKGFISIRDGKAYPNFCIFTAEQYQTLKKTVFEPLREALEPEMQALRDDFDRLYRDRIPAQIEVYSKLFTDMAMGDIAYVTTILAFQENRLYVPKDEHDGEFLTLMYIKR